MSGWAKAWVARLWAVLAAACLLAFLGVGAWLWWRVETFGPLAFPNMRIVTLTVAAADLGWRFWAR